MPQISWRLSFCEERLMFPAALFCAPSGIGFLLWPHAAGLNRKPLLALRRIDHRFIGLDKVDADFLQQFPQAGAS